MPSDIDDGGTPWRASRWPIAVAAAVLLFGLVLSLLGAQALRTDRQERERLHLRQQAAGSMRQLELALQLALESLTSVKAFHDAGGARDAQQFDRFVRSEAAFHDGTLALGWAPRIGDAGRAQFEAWMSSRSGRPEAIFEATGHGLRRVVHDCADCYPVQYLTALSGGDIGPGINLPSLPSRARAIEAALASGAPSATKARRSDVWGADGDLVIQAFLPVFEQAPPDALSDTAAAPVAGLAMGVFNVSALLRRVFATPIEGADVALFDLDAPAVEQRLFTQGQDDSTGLPNDFATATQQSPSAAAYEFRVADRHWVGLFSPRAASGTSALLLPLGGLLGGVLVTSLLAIYLFAALVRGRQVSWLSGRLDGARQRLVDQQITVALERDLRQQAQAVVSARSSFLQAASHDLRQPLHALGLYLGLLAERPATARDAGFMRRMQQSAAALQAMFDALLDLGRLESGHIEPELRRFDLAPLIERLGQETTALAQRSGLRLIVRAAPATVVSDPLLVERIVRNLLVNAVRYAESGWVAVRVAPRGAWVDVQVMDSGPGIAPARRERIFQPYVRDARHVEGVGLGLAIVQTLAHQMGHELRLRSRVGRGSVFSLRLPASLEAAEPALPARSTAEHLAPVVAPMLGTRVLLVDDDPEVVAATAQLLRAWGAEVVVATGCAQASARMAEQAVLNQPFDLLVLDQHLPDGRGCDWLRDLRAQTLTGLPALLITAEATPALRDAAAAAGAVLVAKPLPALKLRAAVMAVLPPRPRLSAA